MPLTVCSSILDQESIIKLNQILIDFVISLSEESNLFILIHPWIVAELCQHYLIFCKAFFSFLVKRIFAIETSSQATFETYRRLHEEVPILQAAILHIGYRSHKLRMILFELFDKIPLQTVLIQQWRKLFNSNHKSNNNRISQQLSYT
jgi:hypothetical protein